MDSTCCICGAAGLTPKFRIKKEMIYRCPSCGTETWDWRNADLDGLYAASYFTGGNDKVGFGDYGSLEGSVRSLSRRRIAMLRSMLPDARRLVEVGCAYGFFLDEARAAGFEVCGVDVSAHARQFAETEHSLEVFADVAEVPGRWSGRTDVVAMWDTLEHLASPAAALESANSLLRTGGLLAISTGAVDTFWSRIQGRHWHLYSLPEHLFFFSRRGLATLLKRTGFAPVAMLNEWASYPIWYLLERVERGLLKREVAREPKAKRGILSLELPATLGTVCRAVARKTRSL